MTKLIAKLNLFLKIVKRTKVKFSMTMWTLLLSNSKQSRILLMFRPRNCLNKLIIANLKSTLGNLQRRKSKNRITTKLKEVKKIHFQTTCSAVCA